MSSQLQETAQQRNKLTTMKTIKNAARNAKVEMLLTIAHASTIAAVAIFAVTNLF
jgi:hypothetical protein